MIKEFIIIGFLCVLCWCLPRSEKTVAVIDKLQVNLRKGETKQWNHTITQHAEEAFMVNVDIGEVPEVFPEMTINVASSEQKNTCQFKYATNICVLQKSTQFISVKVECLAPQCKLELNFSQRVLYSFEGNGPHKSKALTLPGQIYKIQKQQFNSILEIYSELKQQFLLPKEIQVYSNVHAFRLTQVLELDANSMVFGLKPVLTENQRYFYIEDTRVDNRQLRFNFKTHGGILKEGVPIVDFIETYGHHFINSYKYDGLFSHHIQAYVRVFSPGYGSNLPFSLVIKGKNDHKDKDTIISAVHLPQVPFKNHKFFDIAFTVTKERHSEFKMISFELLIDKVDNKTVFVEFQVFDKMSCDVHIFDTVYFSSAKDEELSFIVTQQVKYDIQGVDQDVQIITNASQKYLTNQATCSLHKGCNITVKTPEKCEACSFTMDLQGTDIMNHLIYYTVKDNLIEAKIDFEEEFFFKKTMEPAKYYQIVTNTPNIMIYANFEGYKRCKLPSPLCHQYAINQQTPQLIANTEKTDQALIIMIVGLQMTEFKVRFIENTKGLKLSLGQKFSYLFDDQEPEINLEFNTDRQTFSQNNNHINFNLISPTNSLQLTVVNQDGMTSSGVDGYVQFDKKDLASDKFLINIKKIGMFTNQYVHMTFIVSTADTVIRLDSTSTHYQKYYPQEEKKYLVEFDPSEETSLNIYTQNLQKYEGTMILTIVDLNMEQVSETKIPIIQKALMRDNEMIDLDLQLQALDLCAQVNCELSISIKSQVKHEIEQMITVLHEESVILLEDSIWNSFEINDLSKTNHFYYIPRQTNKTINILFNTEDKNIFIDYSIFNTKKSINPQNWPWDHHSNFDKDYIVQHLNGHQEFQIKPDHPDIKKCWPTCVVLITVGDVSRKEVSEQERQLIKTYKILVSSTVVEMAEETRFQIQMQPDEENTMFIQLTNFLNSKTQEFTFFSEYKMGRAKITATLVSNGQQYKLGDSNSDFIMEDIETHLPISKIQNVLETFNLNSESTSLQINFKAISTVKMYFEFTSYLRNFYRLEMDDLQIVTLKEGEEVWYEFIPERDYSIKFYRGKGFPLFKIIQCQEQSFIDCLDKHKKLLALQVAQKKKIEERTKNSNQSEKVKDIEVNEEMQTTTAKELQLFIDKNYEYSNELCEQCIVFIWVYCYTQDLQMSINIRSSSTETELKELTVVNDRIEKNQYHFKYLINVDPAKIAMITFRVIEGVCSVEIQDSNSLLFNETFNSVGSDYKDIIIQPIALPSSQLTAQQQENEEDNEPNIRPVFQKIHKNKQKQQIIRHLHLKVTSFSELPIEYLLSYSVGYSGVYMEDGILSQKKMIPDVSHVFYYHNLDKTSHPYLTLSSTPEPGYDTQHTGYQYEVRFFYYPNANRRDIKEEFKPEMPPKKNENYLGQTITHVYQLPTKFQLFEIEVFTKNYLKITASINHKELIYLPIGFEYLIKLQRKESIYFVVERPDTEYLEMSVKKCDTSVPTLYYTNDAKQFKEGIFQTEEEIENGFEKKLIKTKKSSKTIHVKFTAEQDVGSLFTVSVSPSMDPKKAQSHKVKPGNTGILSYNFLDTKKVEIEFSPAICDGQMCGQSTKYYLMVGQTIDSIFGELNCAGLYMISPTQKAKDSEIFEVTTKYLSKQLNVYRMTVELKHKQAFVGVKAVVRNSDGRQVQVMYTPAQIQDLWSQASKMSISIFLIFSFALALIISVVIIVSTKIARRGYRPISSEE